MGTTARRRIVGGIAALAALVAGLTVLTPAVAFAAQDKVVICHRTNSNTNPYNQIAVSTSAAIEAHADIHTGPVFTPGSDNWGDIVPPIPPELPNGLNWPEGRSVLRNGCEMEPDVGPLPAGTVGAVECAGPDASAEVTVSDRPDATRPAFFAIVVDGNVVRRVGPVAPGGTRTVILTGDLAALEDQTVTIEVRSGGEVVASRVVTVDCVGPPPDVALTAELTCQGQTPQATLTATNNGQAPVEVSVTVNGAPVGTPVTIAPGATQSATAVLSAFEDQEVTVAVLVDGNEVASYTATPDCVAPQPTPRVSVDGLVCPPPLATVTLANDGDPDSSVVYGVRVDGRLVQESAPIYGGDSTTIVADLSPYEDRTVEVALVANGNVLGRRVVTVDCEQPAVAPDDDATGPAVPTVVPSGVAPSGGTPLLGPALVGGGLVLLLGSLVVSRRRPAPRRH